MACLPTVLDVSLRFHPGLEFSADDVSATDVQETLAATGPDRVRGRHRPRLRLDNRRCYLSREPWQSLRTRAWIHTPGSLFHRMTQGKIERYHHLLRNLVELVRLLRPLEPGAGGGALRRFQ